MRMGMDPRRGLRRLFAWKVRGIRWIDIVSVILLGVMIFSVYVAKAGAQGESARISDLEGRIAASGERVRLLRAEVAQLERPARLDALSRSAGLGPVQAGRQASAGHLNELAAGQSAERRPASPAPIPDEAGAPTLAATALVQEAGR